MTSGGGETSASPLTGGRAPRGDRDRSAAMMLNTEVTKRSQRVAFLAPRPLLAAGVDTVRAGLADRHRAPTVHGARVSRPKPMFVVCLNTLAKRPGF